MRKFRLFAMFLLSFILAMAGSFLSACGKTNYDSVTLVCSETDLVLEKGGDINVEFTIENYTKSMSNKIIYNSYDTDCLSIRTIESKGGNVTATISALRGGSTTIFAVTEDGYKSCSINVEVVEYTQTLTLSNSVMYLSDSTDFVPDSNYFIFDKFATDKSLTYYVLDNHSEIMEVTMDSGEIGVAEFTKVSLETDNFGNKSMLFTTKNKDTYSLDKVDTLKVRAVYDHSVSEGEENLLYVDSTLYIFSDLNSSLQGNYIDDNYADFTEINLISNKENFSEYYLQLKINVVSSRLKYDDFYSDNFELVFLGYDENNQESTDLVSTYVYFKVTPEVTTTISTNIHIGVYYDVLGKVDDPSIYNSYDIKVNILIAPTSIEVNGYDESEFSNHPLNLYNFYDYSSEFGWEDLNISILKTNSYWSGIYFEFDEQYIEIKYNGVNVSSTPNRLYNSTLYPFTVRGKRNANLVNGETITIHLVSNILDEELTFKIYYNIVAGSTLLAYIDGEDGTDFQREGIHLSLNESKDEQLLFDYITTNAMFDSLTFALIDGTDVVDFLTTDVVCDPVFDPNNISEVLYYKLQIYMTPKALSTENEIYNNGSTYIVYLDNGININMNIKVVETVDQIKVNLTGDDVNILSDSSYSEEDENLISLKVEILNESNRRTGETVYGSTVSFEILGNYISATNEEISISDIVRLSYNRNIYTVSTKANGEKVITFNVEGYYINENFALSIVTKVVHVHIISLSYVNDFIMYNNDNYAYNTTLYYGDNIDSSYKIAEWTAKATPVDSYYFYRYGFDYTEVTNISLSAKATLLTSTTDYANYSYKDDYIFWTVSDLDGNAPLITTDVKVRGVDYNVIVNNGIMFYGQSNENITYSNVYKVGFYGTFSIIKDINDNITFVFLSEVGSSTQLVFKANIQQKSYTISYQINLSVEQYIEVKDIYLGSAVSEVNFNANFLSTQLIVYITPYYATNTNLFVQPVTSNSKYVNLIKISYEKYKNNEGVYLLTLSCEDFYYNNYQQLQSEKEDLSTKIYIMPADWAPNNDYSTATGFLYLNVNFCNGMSMANAYNLETAEDVIAIGQNEHTLSAYYKISTSINMASYQDAGSIGILDGKNLGFSGTIVGLSDQASISGIVINENNALFVEGGNDAGDGDITIDYNIYSGLFTKLNSNARIENLIFEGSIALDYVHQIDVQRDLYVGLIAGYNEGVLINVGARLGESYISATNESSSGSLSLYAGGVVGFNKGLLLQYYGIYENENSRFIDIKSNFEYGICNLDVNLENVRVGSEYYEYFLNQDTNVFLKQTPKIMSYMTGRLTINLNKSYSYVGGVAGYSSGIIERVASSSLILYGYAKFTALVDILVNNYTMMETNFNESTDYDNIAFTDHTGGIVGKLEGITEGRTILRAKVNTTIVGGAVEGFYSVGGLVGSAGAKDANSEYEISSNYSRTFVRGYGFVGALIGQYTAYFDGNRYITTKTTMNGNRIEATDDGTRYGYNSSLVIKYILDSDSITQGQENKNIFNSYYNEASVSAGLAIGNQGYDNLGFYNTNSITLVSYITRTFLSRNLGTILSINSTEIDSYYGDYIAVYKNFDDVSGEQISIGMVKQYTFDKGSQAELMFGETKFKMTATNPNPSEKENAVYYMYYFGAEGYIDGQNNVSNKVDAQNILNKNGLNTISSNNKDFYPFDIKTSTGEINSDITISSLSTNILTVDEYGSINVIQPGIATLKITSILNYAQEELVHIYVINYCETYDVSSILYLTDSRDSTAVNNTTNIHVHGSSITPLYILPDYTYYNEDITLFSVTEFGNLKINNTSIKITANTALSSEIVVLEKVGNDYIYIDLDKESNTVYQDNGQVILISKNNNITTTTPDDKENIYRFYIRLKVTIEGKEYYYDLIKGSNSSENYIESKVIYHEGATDITTDYLTHGIKSNSSFDDNITITSANKNENLYYQIKDEKGVVIQERMTESISIFGEANNITNADLFDIEFTKIGENCFNYVLNINKNSDLYLSRYEKNIYQDYYITFYASEKTEGVSRTVKFVFDESYLDNIDVSNYQSINDLAVADDTIVPGQYGLLEINLEPIDSVFDYIMIENTDQNYTQGSGTSTFSLVYEKPTEFGVEYVNVENFGQLTGRGLKVDYNELLRELKKDNISYNGTIYIRYFMATAGVENQSKVQFKITYSYNNEEPVYFYKNLTVKLANYVKVTLDAREEEAEGKYNVARGVTYNLTMVTYGYTVNQVTFNSDNERYAWIEWVGGVGNQLVLRITNNQIPYVGESIGFSVNFEILASKVIDGKTYTYIQELHLTIMEYIFNYRYDPTRNIDIIKDMHNGVIDISLGSKQELVVDLNASGYMEYDATNSETVRDVENFVRNLQTYGEYKVWTNLNANNPEGIATKGDLSGAITTDKGLYPGTSNKLGNDVSITTIYFKITDFTIIPLRTYSSNSDYYLFSFDAFFGMNMGRYYVKTENTEEENVNRMYTEFRFSVHQQSSEESPIPITNYEEFISMQDNQYYILLTDIILNNEDDEVQFDTISANIAGFDGNGYSLIYYGKYNFDSNSIGTFQNVNSGTVIKNLTIKIRGSVTFAVSSDSFNVGVVAVTNSGNITNCAVEGENNGVLSVLCLDSTSNSTVAGLVYSNSGYITNSHVSTSIYSTINISGFVGINSKKIASSYFMNGILKNSTAYFDNTAGFVLENREDAQIITSYVSGTTNQNHTYYQGKATTDYILSSYYSSGFAFTNLGSISDCYSNIYVYGGSNTAGFVYENGGKINRCFSLSELENFRTSSFGFARTNEVTDTSQSYTGTFEDCYYMKDTSKTVNTSLSTNEYVGISALESKDFSNLDEYFSNYTYSTSMTHNTIWFYSSGYSYVFNGRVFNINRLELAAPNIIAFSQKELYDARETTDIETGETSVTYIYTYVSDYALGDNYNPILISNSTQFETYFLQENSSSNINSRYYRLIADIDYAEYDGESQIYNTILLGGIEGNGMDLSNIALRSSAKLTNAGLFAQIGTSSYSSGFIFNLNITIKEMSFVNASCVGALAGRIENAQILNVNIASSDENELTLVAGKNIVGGLVGLALYNYKIQNVIYEVTASAGNIASDEKNNFSQASTNYEAFSFAGGLVGVASGTGSVVQIFTDREIKVVGNKIGLVIGFVDSDVTVKQIDIMMNADMSLRALSYGGIVIGESKGKISHVNVYSVGYELNNLFITVPYIPEAVGGIVGLMSGGSISRIYMSQSLTFSTVSAISGISVVGGIVGMTDEGNNNCTISQVIVDASLTSFATVGGVIGVAQSASVVTLSEIAVKDITLSVTGRSYDSAAGGFIGIAKGSTIVSITNSYSWANITIDTYTINTSLLANIGEFIGSSANLFSNNGIVNCYSTTKFTVSMQDKVINVSKEPNLTLEKCLNYTDSSVYCRNSYTFNYSTSIVLGNCRLKSALEEGADKYHDFSINYKQLSDQKITDEDLYSKIAGYFTGTLEDSGVEWIANGDENARVLSTLAFERDYEI